MSACPAFGGDGPAGIADALRSVDCLASEATASAFGRLFGADGTLGAALTIALTFYVALLAIDLLTGRSRLNLSMLTPRMLSLGLVLTFATSWVAYQNVVWTLALGGPDQIASLLIGSHGSATMLFANRLDMLFGAVADAAQAVQAATPADKPGSFTAADLLWLAALMLLLGTVGMLIVARIALAALLALGPIFIVLALFRGTRGLFEGWLKGVVLFAIIPLLTVLIGGGALAMIAPAITGLAMAGGEVPMRAAVTIFLGAAVYVALMAIVLKVATTLTTNWRLPWREEPMNAPSPAVASSIPIENTPAWAVPAWAMSDRTRVNAIVSGLHMPANDAPAMMQAGRLAGITKVVLPMAVSPLAVGDDPTRGIGRRFRAPVAAVSREIVS